MTAADAERALRQVGAWQFVQECPGGLQSIVGERGAKLSGGQRQRIVIARALAHRPRLLILDEATSALDPESEADICQVLKNLTPGITVIAVSHRPAMIRIADQILEVRDGKVLAIHNAVDPDGTRTDEAKA
ncbi:Heterocyst differentiation ATP-binding protein HepA [compost metagenome]